jgi:hypothetical protein
MINMSYPFGANPITKLKGFGLTQPFSVLAVDEGEFCTVKCDDGRWDKDILSTFIYNYCESVFEVKPDDQSVNIFVGSV